MRNMFENTKEKILSVQGRLIKNGIAITVEGRDFLVEYPEKIWKVVPIDLKQLILDNLTDRKSVV